MVGAPLLQSHQAQPEEQRPAPSLVLGRLMTEFPAALVAHVPAFVSSSASPSPAFSPPSPSLTGLCAGGRSERLPGQVAHAGGGAGAHMAPVAAARAVDRGVTGGPLSGPPLRCPRARHSVSLIVSLSQTFAVLCEGV